MKNLQINTAPIGAQEYNLGEKVGEYIYIYIWGRYTHIQDKYILSKGWVRWPISSYTIQGYSSSFQFGGS